MPERSILFRRFLINLLHSTEGDLPADMNELEGPEYLCTNSSTYGKLPPSLFELHGLKMLMIDGSSAKLDFGNFSVRPSP